MKQSHPLLKLTAVASSVLLVSAFVCYRAGAINWFVKSSDQPAEVGHPNELNVLTIEDPASFYLMSGSKSDRIVVPEAKTPGNQPSANPQQPPETTPPTTPILPGSKSLAPIIGVPGLVPADAQPSSPPPPSPPSK